MFSILQNRNFTTSRNRERKILHKYTDSNLRHKKNQDSYPREIDTHGKKSTQKSQVAEVKP